MKNKGFTLIELLAVIVILAIIALIAIPIAINIINDSRENSYKRSIENYGKNVENAVMSYIEKNNVNEIPNTISSYEIKMSGSKVICNNTFDYDDEKIKITNCRVVNNKGEQKSKYTYTYQNRSLISENGDYIIGQEVIVKNEKYNVVGIGDDYVTLFKYEPLTVSEVQKYGVGHINRYTDVSRGQVINLHGYGGIAYYSSEVCYFKDGVTVDYGCKTNYNDSDVKYVVDQWEKDRFKNNELKEVNGYKARLLGEYEIKSVGWPQCSFKTSWCNRDEKTPDWITYGELWSWTMWPVDNNWPYIHEIYHEGKLNSDDVFMVYSSVRPVINIYKSSLQS